MRREKTWRDGWRRDVACDDVAFDLAGAVDSPGELSRLQRRHTDHCLRCQAELAQHRRLTRAMRGLRTELLQPSVGHVADVIALLDEEAEAGSVHGRLLSGRRIAYAGGLAAATAAAGAVSAVLITARSRRARLTRLAS